MRPTIREKKKKSPRLRKSLCCSTTDTLVSYRGLNQSEIVKGGPPLWLAVVQIFLYVCVCVCVCAFEDACAAAVRQRERWVVEMLAALSLNLLCSVNVWQSLQDSAIAEYIENSAIFQIAADFALRRVLWRHRNAHSVKERLFLSSKNGMNSFAFSSCPIYKSYIGQTNRKRNKSALLVWATDRLSARTGAAGCSRSRDTVIHGAGRYSEVVEFTAESITSLSNLVRSIQIRHIIMLKLQISEQTPLMWKPG